MLTPIRPSLSQVLLRQGAGTAAPTTTNGTGAETSNPALAARQAFFRQINGEAAANQAPAANSAQNSPARTPPPRQAPQANVAARPAAPAVFKAADIERAQNQAKAQGETPPPLRPGSLLNIVV